MHMLCTHTHIHTHIYFNTIYVILEYAGFVTITNPQVTDSGIYTCRAKANHSDYDEVTLIIRKRKRNRIY